MEVYYFIYNYFYIVYSSTSRLYDFIFSCSSNAFIIFYAVFNSKRSLSAIIAINSLFVGLPFAADTVYPNIFSTSSFFPLDQATSIAWRIALKQTF